jgi:uncharacterized PurR-regulated membrane protein YhhQ (DUF165 family)
METPPPSLWSELLGAIAYRDPAHLPLVLLGLAATGALIWYLKGRTWAYISTADLTSLLGPVFGTAHKIVFNPLTIATGMVFVVRDFVQREMGHRVLILMALAIAWSFYYSWPVIALASATAFAISESVDWVLFTFTKYRLSTRILLSSAVAAPIDTTVFLYGADLAQSMAGLAEPGSQLNTANWIFFIIGKLVGAVVVSTMIRYREKRGEVDPAAA